MTSALLTNSHAQFMTTCWDLVRQAGSEHDPAATRVALGELASRYWPAAYAYLRRSGHTRDRAADLAQGFFAEVVLWRDLFGRADPARGKLRSLLLGALKNYVLDQHRRAGARPDAEYHASRPALDTIEVELAEDSSPEGAFDRQWAKACLDLAIVRCREHFIRSGRAAHWTMYERRELLPSLAATEPPPLAALCDELNCRSASQAAAMVQTVKLRLRALLADITQGDAPAAPGAHPDGHAVASQLLSCVR